MIAVLAEVEQAKGAFDYVVVVVVGVRRRVAW
jgi:hypothetical protein